MNSRDPRAGLAVSFPPELAAGDRSRAGGLLGVKRLKEARAAGLAFAARWRNGRREEVLTAAAVAMTGLDPRPAIGRFPYSHRHCGEW